ncbi:alpha/beta-hydrolase [Aspergillus homomorphus CBS 101889]|uniref:Alpha/beta-hydrolase n=1 Tax=Aspergillus homomorphus (strain CBS 101889) TaxID=1450537 RepID=A0A395HM13_ASPHC|nr:alpha/beta-hydrolase [Aspergillus homomorphus CBS 101889]RAL08463.1 alpha/beta-hydrolase [Aspergillus homomorphus CBS 101889]
MLSLWSAALLVALPIQAQFVAPPTDLIKTKGYLDVPVRYKQVPNGICETDPSVKSFSGYLDVAEHEHIFFWFFEARNQDPKEAPLTVWINGGPGSSSMIGLFQENGPCGVDSNGSVYNNPYSWSNASNMLYIDQPVQTGFSYSIPVPAYVDSGTSNVVSLPSTNCPDYAAGQSCGTYSYPNISLTANSTDNAAPNFYRALQGFMGAFPQYSRQSFHFTTESYGGHYGPVFNEYIEQQNANLPHGAKKIKLESVMIGNGWYDPIIQYQAFYNFTVYPGNTYDYLPYNDSISSLLYNNIYGPGNCLTQLRDCAARGDNAICSVADNFCANEVESIYDNYLGRDEYDIRELTPDPFPYGFYVDYLNTAAVQAAIGAVVNFTESNNAVSAAFSSTGDDGRRMRTTDDFAALLQQGVTVAMYAGDADYNCNWLGGEAVAVKVGAPGFHAAGYTNISTSDGVMHGQVRQAGRFAFVRVYESGHEVPFYQPLLALELFERVIGGKDVATGKLDVASGYRTVGAPKSTYREGNGTVQWQVLDPLATYNTTTNAPNPVEGKRFRRKGLRKSALRLQM